MKFQPEEAIRGDHIALKASWTKGGRARTIPITTLEQRQVLDEAKRLVPGRGSLIPVQMTYVEHLKRFEYQTLKAGLRNTHGHLLTIAPTRSGKAVTSIVPNLLRYRGSCVVIDPKGEHYEMTSRWRKSIGHEIYRIAPFDHGSGWARHRYNPLAVVRSDSDARSLAEQMFPRDPQASAFFNDDAAGFLTAAILYVKHNAPPHRRNLAAVCQLASQKGNDLLNVAKKLAEFPLTAKTGEAILQKTRDRGLQTLEATLESKLALWRDRDIQSSLSGSDFSFEDLKDRPITVYIDVPFGKMAPYAPWLRILLKGALDAMESNRRIPDIPVLFILDEFLNLGPFPEFRAANHLRRLFVGLRNIRKMGNPPMSNGRLQDESQCYRLVVQRAA